MLNKICCPKCGGEFKTVPKSVLSSCSGLWCPKCFKVFAIPEDRQRATRVRCVTKDAVISRYVRLLAQGIRRGISVAIALDQFILWWNSEPDSCHYCGCSLADIARLREKFNGTKQEHYFNSLGLTIDRKDSNVGYCAENIVKCCLACNLMKGAIMSESEAKMVCSTVINRYLECC